VEFSFLVVLAFDTALSASAGWLGCAAYRRARFIRRGKAAIRAELRNLHATR
jgi:hypothetical protein